MEDTSFCYAVTSILIFLLPVDFFFCQIGFFKQSWIIFCCDFNVSCWSGVGGFEPQGISPGNKLMKIFNNVMPI